MIFLTEFTDKIFLFLSYSGEEEQIMSNKFAKVLKSHMEDILVEMQDNEDCEASADKYYVLVIDNADSDDEESLEHCCKTLELAQAQVESYKADGKSARIAHLHLAATFKGL